MSEELPESFEVLTHIIKNGLIKYGAKAPHNEKDAQTYMGIVEDVIANEHRLKAVLEIIGKDIFSILRSMPVKSGEYKSIKLTFDYEPDVHESMLADWLASISEDQVDEFYGLIELLSEEDHDTVRGFLLSLMNFYLVFIQSNT